MPNGLVDTDHVLKYLDKMWFKLQSMDIVRASEMEQQLLDSHALLLLKNGESELTIDYMEYRLRQDAVHFASPGQTVGISGEDDGIGELYVIRFDVYWDSGTPDECNLQGELPIHRDAESVMLCELIYSCTCSEYPLERFRGQSAFQELLFHLFNNIRLLPESDPRSALDRTKAFINSHYSENLTIDRLAAIADLSPKYYVDLFKKTYGKSAIDYITEVRLRHAKQMMVHSDVRMRDIAHQVGYHDEFYFSRKFKKEMGVSPSIYVKNRRRKIGAYSSGILGQMLALKIFPYAAPLHPKWTAYYYKMYRSEIPIHLSAYRYNQDWEANIEVLKTAQLDIVICDQDQLHPHEKEQLEAIAPVLYIPTHAISWREQLMLTAQFIHAEHEAKCWLEAYDRKVKAAQESLKRKLGDDSIFVMSMHKQNGFISPTRGMNDVLYHDLQLKMNPIFDPTNDRQTISEDQLAMIDSDRILINVCQESDSLKEWKVLQASQLWQDLKAVRKNQVYQISSDPWREYSAYACERMIDDVVKQLSRR